MVAEHEHVVIEDRKPAIELDVCLVAGIVVDDIPGALERCRRLLDELRVGKVDAELIDDRRLGRPAVSAII
jgi:hypothetical protein